jgi:preprotein translocase subunit SecG
VDSSNDTITAITNSGNENLPLASFFADLKQNGFSVTPLQLINANRVILQYANWVKNEADLYMYLCPIFAGNEDEQVLFKTLFHKHFTTEILNSNTEKQKPSIEKKLKQHWKKFLAIYTFLAILVICVIISTSLHTKKFDPSKIEISTKEKNEKGIPGNNETIYQVKTNDKLELLTTCRYNKRQSELETVVLYNWGDNTSTGELPSHIYITPGKYHLTVYADVRYKNNSIKKDTLRRTVNVCSSDNSLIIELPSDINSLIPERKIKLSAIVNNKKKLQTIKWQLDGKETGNGEKAAFLFTTAGKHVVNCTAVYDSINSPCNIERQIVLIIHNTKDFLKPTAQPTDSIINKQEETVAENKTNTQFLSYLYQVLAAIFFLLSLFFISRWIKELNKTGRIKTTILDKYKKLTSSFAATKAPAILPFKNRNYLPVHESEIDNVTKLMRRRVKDSISFLHVEKTIKRSIEKAGFFEPVKEARTRQSEYLVLIDESNENSQLVKLFEYLVVMLKKHNVLVEKFYYRKEPLHCYSINEPGGISLEKLYNKHQRHILLIFGDAHQLIDNTEKSFNKTYIEILQHWQHKAIVTPVSFIDWQQEKNYILPHIPIVPVDMEGLVLLGEMLTERENAFDIMSRLNSNKGMFYKTTGINFEHVNVLERYCTMPGWTGVNENGEQVNILFEWVAALAIYPKIRWEITLAIGKAILDKYEKRNQLNFTILLRIARISWMKEGFISNQLRFELLKKISIENERAARETILMLLQEIPQNEIEPGTGNFEEKEVQQIINEFSLYANDPVFYAAYSESKYMFEKLWKDKKINDEPTELYLKNENRQWKTLVNQHINNEDNNYNTGVDEYLQTTENEETILSKVYLALGLISIVVMISSLAALRVLYIWGNFL